MYGKQGGICSTNQTVCQNSPFRIGGTDGGDLGGVTQYGEGCAGSSAIRCDDRCVIRRGDGEADRGGIGRGPGQISDRIGEAIRSGLGTIVCVRNRSIGVDGGNGAVGRSRDNGDTGKIQSIVVVRIVPGQVQGGGRAFIEGRVVSYRNRWGIGRIDIDRRASRRAVAGAVVDGHIDQPIAVGGVGRVDMLVLNRLNQCLGFGLVKRSAALLRDGHICGACPCGDDHPIVPAAGILPGYGCRQRKDIAIQSERFVIAVQ